jgi:hypothetical protein
MHMQGDREGEGAWLRAQMSRGKWASGVRALKGSGHAEVAGKHADMGASTARVHRPRLGTGSDGWGPRGSERGRSCALKETAPTNRPHWQRAEERERERRGRGLALTGGVHLSGAEGAHARLGLLGRLGLKRDFPFS